MAPLILDPNLPLTDEHRSIATLHFIAGVSVRQIASRHQLSLHTVRRVLADVKSRCEAFHSLHRKVSRTIASLP